MPLHEEVFATQERKYGKEDPHTLTAMHNLAPAYLAQGEYAKAEELLRTTLDARRRVLGKQHPRTLKSLGFHRLNQSVVHEDSNSIRGMINKVRHLVKVEVDSAQTE